MKCDVVKLRAARDRRAMTQEMLAAQAKIDVRTVQRAESGAPLRQETIADLAAVLGLPLAGLIDARREDAEPIDIGAIFGPGLVLRRATNGREVIELLESTHLGKLECDADPNDGIMDVLREAIRFLEGMLPHPWNEQGQNGPLTFGSLVDRLEAISKMSSILTALERNSLALFIGSAWEKAIMPKWSDEGLYVRVGQFPENVRATRLLLGSHAADRVTVQKVTTWPVEIMDDVLDDDLDDAPF